eukprot:CAMPEP_0204602164 /NCGR_PEP_ID=MMETSP0661-20131031/56483_1 /ASSEMBLY_ACC=CAM_ASM_000606 /TAXON_ID=109239 /ORGANISM="Alexandrium margalefi, Strain AMGDE01CS-322" /LENGTH=278 /DNA_ID=CAMNT_0051613101 /DNA_START=30 /DNA_END=866 /DNA_ORIENTATION=-
MQTFHYPELGSLPRIVWYFATRAHLSAQDTHRRLKAVQSRASERRKSDSYPVVINVGVNTLQKEAELYKSLFLPLHAYRFVFVEPNKMVLHKLRQQIRELGIDPESSNVHIVNAAVCPQTGDHMKLYSVNKSIQEVLPEAIYEKMVEMTSLDKERIKKSFDRWLILAPVPMEQALAYVEELPVRCLSPADLLEEVGLSPGEVDFYSCDAEGYDAPLTRMFLEMKGFNPAVVQFEWAWHHDHNETKVEMISRVVRMLHERGYDIAKDTDEIVAIASTLA